ncbi:M23 family metallopeptidase [Caldimonas caldifontis]|uniref:Peptidase M23 n=1 Tax=Caldimonas caldifontis TaxID=1452508 RepID=A0A2S5SSY9_9BURK|nr:M23 family metallopeptidase [Caldimonas caldifontis]PPE65804.1 peptidase M23 [Caldimonas caldifontis]
MQIMITHSRFTRTRVLTLSRWQLAALMSGGLSLLLVLSGLIYHFIFLKAAREGWPVVSQIVRLVVKDEFAQRDRFLRENLDAMARKVGEMQARLVQLEAVGERVSDMVGLKPDEIKAAVPDGPKGGPYVPTGQPSFEQLNRLMDELDQAAALNADMFTLIESQLFEQRVQALMIPNSRPVDAPTSSGFGFREDPFSGRQALHTGLDFPAPTGTPIQAAAGGVVIAAEYHPAYGHMVDIDHGNQLVTRYAHASKLLVKQGDLVKRGQVIAEVGSTGRSTGPHLHFEVLVAGVPQNPARFLAGQAPRRSSVAQATAARPAAP